MGMNGGVEWRDADFPACAAPGPVAQHYTKTTAAHTAVQGGQTLVTPERRLGRSLVACVPASSAEKGKWMHRYQCMHPCHTPTAHSRTVYRGGKGTIVRKHRAGGLRVPRHTGSGSGGSSSGRPLVPGDTPNLMRGHEHAKETARVT